MLETDEGGTVDGKHLVVCIMTRGGCCCSANQKQQRAIWKIFFCVGVKASVLFPFVVQTVYSMHFVYTHLHCCTIRLCNEAGRDTISKGVQI